MTSPRPSTPFPYAHGHVLTHGHTTSYFHEPYSHSTPLHFNVPALPTPTPPSLLKRSHSNCSASSSSSSSSAFRTRSATTPFLVSSRRPSNLSETDSEFETASMPSPPMPTTPVTPLAVPHPSPFDLSTPAYGKQSFTSTSPPRSFSYDPFSPTTSTGELIANLYVSPLAQPVRPKLKRRDTPRPQTTTLGSLRMRSSEDQRTGRLRSVIDGGEWLILG